MVHTSYRYIQRPNSKQVKQYMGKDNDKKNKAAEVRNECFPEIETIDLSPPLENIQKLISKVQGAAIEESAIVGEIKTAENETFS